MHYVIAGAGPAAIAAAEHLRELDASQQRAASNSSPEILAAAKRIGEMVETGDAYFL